MLSEQSRRQRWLVEKAKRLFRKPSSATQLPAPAAEKSDELVLETVGGPITLALPVGVDAEQLRSTSRAPLPSALQTALSLLSPGAICWDLGANIGTFAIHATQAGADVLAIEAGPNNTAALRRTTEASPELNLSLISAAISDTSGTIGFSENGPYGVVVDGGPVLVPMMTGDELFDQRSQPSIDLMKIDIEGSEPAALRGMPRALSSTKAVVIESNDHALRLFNSGPQEVVGLLEAAGFKVFRCIGVELAPVAVSDWQPETTVDYLALRNLDSVDKPMRSGLTVEEQSELWIRDSLIPVATHRERALAAISSAPEAVRNCTLVQERLETIQSEPPLP